jgi:radical SAM superfamily enzyme YgiQ (UPF0313 family)
LERDRLILLINPRFPYAGKDTFPLGLGYIAAVARRHGYSVVTIDENIGQSIPFPTLSSFDVIGLTITTPAFPRAKEILHNLRMRKKPECFILAGGVHATFCPEEVLAAGVDVVIRGEGENSFGQLLSSSSASWDQIPGLSFFLDRTRVRPGIQHTPDAPLIEALDNISYPAHDCFDINRYVPMSVITSRGCPYHCAYCAATAFWQHLTRFRGIFSVLNEITELCSKWGCTQIKFQDSLFTMDKRRTLELLHGFQTISPSFQWSCETRADYLDDELIVLMARTGCKSIMLGIESGDQSILDHAERHMNLDQIKTTCRAITAHGIGLRISVIFGLPGETAETVEKTITLLQEIQPNVTFLNLATVYPGCKFAENPSLRFASHSEQWLAGFGGHGPGGKIILPEGMTVEGYRKLANQFAEYIRQLNRIHWDSSSSSPHM